MQKTSSLNTAVLLVGVIIIGLDIGLNIWMHENLFLMGVNFIRDYQDHHNSSQVIIVIQNLISVLCNPIFCVVLVCVYYFVTRRKMQGVVFMSYVIVVIFFTAIMKQIYQESRPFWYNSRVHMYEWTCPKDFGNPSGHSLATFLVYEPLIADRLGFLGYRRALWLFLVGIGILVPVSRMYLGSHSANQVVMGLTLGLTFAVLYRYIFQKFLYEFFWELVSKPVSVVKVVLVVLLQVGFFCLSIIFYQLNSESRPMNFQDLANVNRGCGVEKSSLDYQTKAMLACCLIQAFFGFISVSYTHLTLPTKA